MSRRSGRAGRPRHADHRTGPRPHDASRGGRPGAPSSDAAGATAVEAFGETAREAPAEVMLRVEPPIAVGSRAPASADRPSADRREDAMAMPRMPAVEEPTVLPVKRAAESSQRPAQLGPGQPDPSMADRPIGLAGPAERSTERNSTCTTAQLRRFIKSRAYLPMHEIRRRFLIAAEDDEVAGIELGSRRIYVGLPLREATMLGDLLRAGEVGYELQLDPIAPVVVGVYPMRPVTRS
jgi:hypothetical protein